MEKTGSGKDCETKGTDEKGVSVVVPVFNEEESIAATLKAIDECLIKTPIPSEIIIVNDGSTDGTSAILHDLQPRFRNLVVIEHEENRGYGASLKTGIGAGRFDRVLIIDADQTYPIQEIPRLIERSDNFDMVVGSREGAKVHRSFFRRPAKFILTKLAEFLSNRRIPDLNSGFRIFRKEIARNWFHMFPDGFSFTSTLTIIALHKGYRTHYLPINYLKRKGKSKIRPIRDTLNFINLILRTVLYVNPLRIFIPASLFFFAISLSLFAVRVFFGRAFLVTIIITFICGFQLLLVGVIADLIDKRLR
jgi:glycosyltransferase involved in cell wall biosynthesis